MSAEAEPAVPRGAALGLYVFATLFAHPQVIPGFGATVDGGTPLAVLAVAALLVGVPAGGAKRRFAAALLASFIAHALVFHWFAVATIVHGGMHPLLGGLAPAVPALYTACFTALFVFVVSRWPGDATSWPLVAAAALVATEWLRSFVLGGFPWASPGTAGWRNPALLGLAAFVGVHGMTFVIGLLGAGFAQVIRLRRVARGAGVAAALSLGLLATGAWLDARALVEDEAKRVVRVAAIQGNIDPREKWSEARVVRNLERHLELSRRAAAAGAELIVWPETAVPGLIEHDPRIREPIQALARETGASFVLGATGATLDPSQPDDPLAAVFDSAFVMDAAGRLLDRYDKTKRVPFGEFVPFRAWLGGFFEALARGLARLDVSAGAAPRSLEVPLASRAEVIRVGVPICYELIFPDTVRQMARDRARLLLGITNDAWYGRTGARPQFLAMTAIRAAENRLPVLRAANTGISAWIDARGRVRERTAWDVQDVLVGDIPLLPPGGEGPAGTFYARHGDVFAMACAGVTGALLLLGLRRTRATEQASSAPGQGPSQGRSQGEEAS